MNSSQGFCASSRGPISDAEAPLSADPTSAIRVVAQRLSIARLASLERFIVGFATARFRAMESGGEMLAEMATQGDRGFRHVEVSGFRGV